MMSRKKYVARVIVSAGVMFQWHNHLYYCRVLMASNKQLQDLLEQVARGDLDPDRAREWILDALRERPFEDLGFARIDHHRSIRQGFPEVILGLGKTPAQVAAIAKQIVSRGSTLLVT